MTVSGRDCTQDWQAQVSAALAGNTSLRIRGLGSKDFLGEQVQADGDICTLAHNGILDYAPTELVLTARSGTRLSEINAALAAHGQFWPCEPPLFGGQQNGDATLGGAVAAGLAGPGRVAYGAVRDFVLGAGIVTGTGKALQFGGRVMKNVAGYDVARLLAGSMGTLGLITDVSIKVLPLPEQVLTLAWPETISQAQARFLQASLTTTPCTAAAWLAGTSYMRFAGSALGVQAAHQRLGGELVADDIWRQLRDHQLPLLAAANNLWRVSVAPAASALLTQTQVLDWHGGQRWLCDPLADPRVGLEGGHATLFRAPAEFSAPAATATARFQPLTAVVRDLHLRLKQQFDPGRLFNPGRLYRDL
ncbi:MAG: glycolate oxidase subunit GlcE [Pseudomonadales bacterium]|nr:glycolate oxidase subunit GlcE [Pseudomonadales bacterium]MDP4912048.1 glycolate oxidase subunit GlcE [Pseudomonadales bacterium]